MVRNTCFHIKCSLIHLCSLDLLINPKSPKSTKSKHPLRHFFQLSSPALCVRNLGKTYPGLFSTKNVLRLTALLHRTAHQQFIIFTEGVEQVSLFLSEISLHQLFNTNVEILCKIVRYSKDLGIAGHLPTARELWHGLNLQSENSATA